MKTSPLTDLDPTDATNQPVEDLSGHFLAAARRAVCARAHDAQDAGELLAALGLLPAGPVHVAREAAS